MENGRTVSFYALGTANFITAFGCVGDSAIRLARDRVLEVDDEMSAFKPGSDISILNDSSGCGPVRLHGETVALLNRALEYSRLSGGAFDCTVRPLTKLWGIGKKGDYVPTVREITELLPFIGYNGLEIDAEESTAALAIKEMAVDLGGIAKGFAADEAKRILAECGVVSALVNLGGNIATLGCRPDGHPWRIGIQNPLAATGEFLGVLSVSDKTVVTSGCNERFFIRDGVRYHHILDPRTGRPAQSGLLSVTAVCGSSTDADALTTALFVLGRERGTALLQKTGAEAVFISDDLAITATDGLAGTFERLDER